jgi:N-acetylneuraminic acid mutarotase
MWLDRALDVVSTTDLLHRRFNVTIDDAVLQRELERICGSTRNPEELRRIFRNLDWSPFLIKEIVVRPALVDRLASARRLMGFGAADELRAATTAPEETETVRAGRESAIPAAWLARSSQLPAIFDGAADHHPKIGPMSPADDGVGRWAPTMPPTGWYGQSAIWTGTEMIIWGADDDTGECRGASYDPVIDAWAPISSVDAPSPRWNHGAVWTGEVMVIWGGEYSDPDDPFHVEYPTTGGRYDPVADTWAPTSLVDVPPGRTRVVPVWTGSRMFVWGGRSDIVSLDGRSDLYDPITDTWTESTGNAPADTHIGYTAVWTGSEILIWGGYNWDLNHFSSGLYKYDPATDSWSGFISGSGLDGRRHHTAVWTGTEMIVWGGEGYDGTLVRYGDGARYDPATSTWTPVSMVGAPEARRNHTAVWTDDRMIVWGGYVDSRGRPDTNGGASYDPLSDTWTTLPSTSAPTPRFGHSAVWTGSEMIVWGGNPEVQTGGCYNPATDSWRRTVAGYPLDRLDHTAVWTGAEMIVWGGQDVAGHVIQDSGALYDPVLDGWRATSRAGAPPPRWNHTAVWANDEMIVWGGQGEAPDFTHLDSGGRYDPVADAWTAVSGTGAPAARTDHGAVWTGTEMIVWGGWNDPDQLGSGGRYSPTLDTWAPMSELAAPDPRSFLTAVWSGTEMIVWGGRDWLGSFNSGGRYNPSTDSWLPTSQVDAPLPASNVPGLWTGQRMIVWRANPYHIATGGLYDPVADLWTPMNTDGEPSERLTCTAVWTGESMVAWGGSGDRTGGVYDPVSDSWRMTSTAGAPGYRMQHTAVWTGRRMLVWGGAYHSSLGVFDPDLPLFADGFESGNTGAWSGTTP